MALNVTVPFPVPEAGLRVNHETASLALQLKVPPASVADRHGLRCRIGTALSGGKGERSGTGADGRRYGAVATVKVTGTVTGVTPVPALSVTMVL